MPHLPAQIDYDSSAADIDPVLCPNVAVPYYADHLHNITAPMLYVGAAGGFGVSGYYTTTLVASQDVTKLTVQLLPDDERNVDFGHGDTVAAEQADNLVWKPILNWIRLEIAANGESAPFASRPLVSDWRNCQLRLVLRRD